MKRMTDEADDNATTDGDGSSADDGSATNAADTGTQAPDELALARRRQAGADAARATAERQRDALVAELAALKGAGQTQEATDAATLKEQLRIANEDLAKAAADKTSAVLDVKFPAARAKFPAITDEVQLAELEGFYGTTGDAEPPTPRQHNASKNANQPAPREKTANDIEAELLALEMPGV
jgi:hypothetical protein